MIVNGCGRISGSGSPVHSIYVSYGKISKINNTHVLISELPVGKWTENYKEKVLMNLWKKIN